MLKQKTSAHKKIFLFTILFLSIFLSFKTTLIVKSQEPLDPNYYQDIDKYVNNLTNSPPTYGIQNSASPQNNQIYGISNRNPEGGSVTITNPLAGIADDLPGLIGYLLNIAKIFASSIAVIMIIIGAYQILFSAGSPDKLRTGIHTIVYAIIGFAIVLLGDIIVSIIREIIG